MDRPTRTDREAAGRTIDAHRYELALEAGRRVRGAGAARGDHPRGEEPLMRVFGVTPETFGGTFGAYLALLHPDDVAPTVASVEVQLRSPSGHRIEDRVLAADG